MGNATLPALRQLGRPRRDGRLDRGPGGTGGHGGRLAPAGLVGRHHRRPLREAIATELRLVTELCRGRPERYWPIVAHLRERGCDVALVRRGMAFRRVPDALQREIVSHLSSASIPRGSHRLP